jgi:hypothetical protein
MLYDDSTPLEDRILCPVTYFQSPCSLDWSFYCLEVQEIDLGVGPRTRENRRVGSTKRAGIPTLHVGETNRREGVNKETMAVDREHNWNGSSIPWGMGEGSQKTACREIPRAQGISKRELSLGRVLGKRCYLRGPCLSMYLVIAKG